MKRRGHVAFLTVCALWVCAIPAARAADVWGKPELAVSCVPVSAHLRAAGGKDSASVKVLDVSSEAVYAVPILNGDPKADAYETNFGWAMRLRQLSQPFPFAMLDTKALEVEAPWILKRRAYLLKARPASQVSRDLLDKLNRPILEASGAELPEGTIYSRASVYEFLWEMAQRDGGRRYLNLARAMPELMGPAWAYFSAARDELRRTQKQLPSELGKDLLLHLDTLEVSLGRLMMPSMPMGNDLELLQTMLGKISRYASAPVVPLPTK